MRKTFLKYQSVVKEAMSLGLTSSQTIERVREFDARTVYGSQPTNKTILTEYYNQKAGKTNSPSTKHHHEYEKDPKRKKAIKKMKYRVVAAFSQNPIMNKTEVNKTVVGGSPYIQEAIRQLLKENLLVLNKNKQLECKVF